MQFFKLPSSHICFQDLNEETTAARIKAFSSITTKQIPTMKGFFLVYFACECLAISIFGTIGYNFGKLFLPKLKSVYDEMDLSLMFPLLPKDGYCRLSYQSPAQAPIVTNVLCSIRHSFIYQQFSLFFIFYYLTGSLWIIGHWCWLITTVLFQCARR